MPLRERPISEISETADTSSFGNDVLEYALETSYIGFWAWEPKTDELFCSNRVKEIFRLPLETPINSFEFFQSKFLAPEAIDLAKEIQNYFSKKNSGKAGSTTEEKLVYSEELNMTQSEGSSIWVNFRAQAIYDKEGVVTRYTGSILDITDNVKLRENQRKSEEELRLIFDNVPAKIWFKDAKNNILRLNKQAANSMNLEVKDAEGTSTYDLFPDMAKKYHEDDLKVINSGEPMVGIIEEYTPLNGERGWIRTDKIPYTDPETNEFFIFVTSIDITQQKLAEEAIREREARLNLVLDSSNDGIWDWMIQDNYEYMSPRFWEMFGIDPLTKRHHPDEWQDIIFQEDLEVALHNFAKHVQTKGKHPYAQEVRYRHSDGSTVTVFCRGRVVEWDENGEPIRMIGTHTDLTDLKKAQRKARLSAARFELAAKGSSVGIWDWPIKGQDSFWISPLLIRYLGHEDDPDFKVENIEDFQNLFVTSDRQIFSDALEEHFQSKEPFACECRLLHKTKGTRWFLLSGQARWNTKGEPVRMIGSVLDIQKLKETQFDLEDRTRKLEQANKDLDHFAYVASHDLKAPLRGMDNIASWIQEDLGENLTPDIKEKFDLMQGRIKRLEILLKDILAFSRAGRQISENEVINCSELIDEVASWIELPDGITIRKASLLPHMPGVKTLYEHIFLNLISNAIKHHDKPEGEIVISSQEHSTFFKFAISDDGPGIPPQYHQHIFQIFKKLKPRDEVEGSGIGLSIVKKMIESVGGEIWVISPAGERGTTFHFTIPKKKI